MNWLISGGSGFTGSYLIDKIHQEFPEDEVLILDSKPPEFILYPNVSYLKIDLLNEYEVNKIVTQTKPKRIIHLAGLMRDENPFQMVKINVMTCGNLLNIVKKKQIEIDGFLVIGSVAQYGKADPEKPPKESDVCCPKSLYGYSKLLQEELALSYFKKYQIPVICVRPSNIIGPNQSRSFIIPHLIDQMLSERKKEINLDHLNSGRDYIDIRDITSAYIQLFNFKQTRGKIFNIGNNKLIYLQDIIEILEEILHEDKLSVVEKKPQSSPDNHLTNSNKIRTLTSWKPRYDLKTSLNDMVNSYSKK